MSFRKGLAATLGLAFLAGGCATAGTGGVTPMMEGDLPEWVEELPEGTPPEDNQYTEEAVLFLLQAQQFADGEEAEEGFQDALQVALDGIEAYPENPQSYMQAGEAYMGLRDYAGADSMFTKAEELYPRYVVETDMHREEAWIDLYNTAIEHNEAGDLQSAIDYFEQAHQIYRLRPEAMINLGAAYTEVGREDDAVEMYTQAAELLDGGLPEYRMPEDEELLEAWAELEEVAVFNRAQLFLRLENFEEAIGAFEAILERDPDNLMARSNLAVSLVETGRDEEAAAIYEELLADPDMTPQDLFQVGVGLYQVDAFDQAADAFEAVLERIPNHRDAIFNLAQTYFLAENWEALEHAAERLIELDPYNEDAYRFLAQSLVERGDENAAVEWLEEMEALPFGLQELTLQQVEGGFVLVGMVTNRTMDEGTPVRIRFNFTDVDGQTVESEEVEVPAPGADGAAEFQVDLPTDEVLFAFDYEVLSP